MPGFCTESVHWVGMVFAKIYRNLFDFPFLWPVLWAVEDSTPAMHNDDDHCYHNCIITVILQVDIYLHMQKIGLKTRKIARLDLTCAKLVWFYEFTRFFIQTKLKLKLTFKYLLTSFVRLIISIKLYIEQSWNSIVKY